MEPRGDDRNEISGVRRGEKPAFRRKIEVPQIEIDDLTSPLAKSVLTEIVQLGNGRKTLSPADGGRAYHRLQELGTDSEAAAQAVQWTRNWALNSKDENIRDGAWIALACGDPNVTANILKEMLDSDRESALEHIHSLTRYLGSSNRVLIDSMAPALDSIHSRDRLVAFEVIQNCFVHGNASPLWGEIALLGTEVVRSARLAGVESQRLARAIDSLRQSFFADKSEVGQQIVVSLGTGWRSQLGIASAAVEQFSKIVPHQPTTIALLTEIEALFPKAGHKTEGGQIYRLLEEMMDCGRTVEDAAGRLVQWTKKKLNRDDDWFADKALLTLTSVDRVAACAVVMERIELSAKRKERFFFDERLVKALGSDATPLFWRVLAGPSKNQDYPFGSIYSLSPAASGDILPDFCRLISQELAKMEKAGGHSLQSDQVFEHAWKAGWKLLAELRSNLSRPEPATYQATSAGIARIIERILR